MTTGYCKVRNCDTLKNADSKSCYYIPKVRIKAPLTPTQELRLKRRKAWLKALGYDEEYDSLSENDNLAVCPKHFVSGKPAPLKDVDNVDWVPSLHLGPNDSSELNNLCMVDLTEDPEHDKESISEQLKIKKEIPSDMIQGYLLGLGVAQCSVKRKLPPLKPSPQLAQKLKVSNETDSGCSSGESANINMTYSAKTPSTSGFKEVSDMNGTNPHDIIEKLNIENQRLLSQNLSLKAKLLETESLFKSLETDHRVSMSKFSDLRYLVDKFTINEKTFVADEGIVRRFTGLPTYDVLKAMFIHIEHFIDTTQYPLTKFQQYILTLMCIRLNIGFDLLAYVFRLPIHFVSKIFTRVLQVMYARYKPLVSWPARANLFQSVPLLFRETLGQRVVAIAVTLELPVVIDSIEVRFDGSSENGSSTVVSECTHPTNVTFVIGLTPQGAVTFVSKSLATNLSEKEQIENSGLLLNLVPGDIVLATKDLSINEIVENKLKCYGKDRYGISTRSLLRLRPHECSAGSEQNISNVKLHVERVTDTFKKSFKNWTTGLPVEFFNVGIDSPPAIEKMIQTCCALNNASLTVVS